MGMQCLKFPDLGVGEVELQNVFPKVVAELFEQRL